MSRDLDQFLHDTAVEPRDRPDPSTLVRRGRRRRHRRHAVGAAAGLTAVALVGVTALRLAPTPAPQIVDQPAPTGAPATPTPSPTAAPSSVEAPAAGSEPPSLQLLDELETSRLVVEHDDVVWARVGDEPWRQLGPGDEVRVVGDGRWWYDPSSPAPSLRSVDDDAATCPTPTDAFAVTDALGSNTTVIHEDGLTSVFVVATDGTFESVVCEDPDRPTPIEGWRPPENLGEEGSGPYVTVDHGVRLVSYADAEGNLTVSDATGSNVLIEYAISGPAVDADRDLLVYVAQEGGMHFAGGTLVVTDLAGDELRRVDLGGPSSLGGLLDGLAVVERVQPPELTTERLLLVDVTDGTIVDEAATDVSVRYAGGQAEEAPSDSGATNPSNSGATNPSTTSVLQDELAALLDDAGYQPLGGDHDIGVATDTIREQVDGTDVGLGLTLWDRADAEALDVTADFDSNEVQDGGGATVLLGSWSDGVGGAVLECPERTLIIRPFGTPAAAGAAASERAAVRLADAWGCTGFDG